MYIDSNNKIWYSNKTDYIVVIINSKRTVTLDAHFFRELKEIANKHYCLPDEDQHYINSRICKEIMNPYNLHNEYSFKCNAKIEIIRNTFTNFTGRVFFEQLKQILHLVISYKVFTFLDDKLNIIPENIDNFYNCFRV